jgi:hypothetical protein
MRSPRLTGSSALALLFGAAFPFLADAQPIAPTLSLVSARNGIAGTFRSPRSVYADATRIYLASDEGTLFVLARDAARNFPLLQTIRDATCPLAAVRGDGQYVYVTSWDGWLRIYRRGTALRRVKSVFIPQGATGECFAGSGDMAVTSAALYISTFQSHVAVAGGRLFLSQLNAGDVAYEIPKSTFVPGRKFGTSFEPNVTVAFDLRMSALT